MCTFLHHTRSTQTDVFSHESIWKGWKAVESIYPTATSEHRTRFRTRKSLGLKLKRRENGVMIPTMQHIRLLHISPVICETRSRDLNP
jgi:hypothetical protein